jgi:hypothetical protein
MPTAQDPNADPQTRQAALVAAMSSLDPEDAGGALQQMLKSSLDPREMQNQRVASVMQGIDKEWRGRQKQPAGPRGPVLTPTGGEGEGQVMPVGLQTDDGTALPTAMPMGEEEPDSESPEYYHHAAQRLEAAGLPREAEKARKEAEKQAKEQAKAKRGKAQDDWKIISGLRDDFQRDTKEMFLVRDHYARMLTAAEAPADENTRGPADMALIFSYMKMLDPTSVVREGEYATAQNAGSVPQNIITMYNNMRTGDKLHPDVRKGFIDQGNKIYGAIEGQHQASVKGYEDLSRRLGQDPANIIKPLQRPMPKAAPKTAAPVAPAKAVTAPAVVVPGKPSAADPLGIR